jgi:hypothetical protein
MDDHPTTQTLRGGSTAGAASNGPAFSAEQLEDPYALFAALREHHPVVWHPGLQMWLITRYHDACAVLGDRRFGKEYGKVAAVQPLEEPVPEPIRTLVNMRDRWFLRRDPPHHTRLKNLVRQALCPEAVAGLDRQIQVRVDALLDRTLDRALGAGTMEVIADLATPLPITMMTHVLGVPELEADLVLRWSQSQRQFGEPGCAAAEWQRGAELTAELLDQLRDIIFDKHRRFPETGLVTHLLGARRQGLIDDDELLATCTLLLFGGSVTTADLIGNGVLALVQHPQHLSRLRRDPSLLPAAVDEALRYDPPLQLCSRVAMTDMQLGGHRVRAGDWVGVLLGSACRDHGQVTDPDVFSLDRTRASLLPFGHGQHFCPGMALARAEAIHAIGALLRRTPRLALGSSPPRRRATFVFRGLAELRVAVG